MEEFTENIDELGLSNDCGNYDGIENNSFNSHDIASGIYSSSIPLGGGRNDNGTFSSIWGRILRFGTKRTENA